VGYRVSRSIDARLLDLDKLGPLLVALSESGVNSMRPPRLGLVDEESVYREVLEAAVRNARERAGVIAAALGEESGRHPEHQHAADRSRPAPHRTGTHAHGRRCRARRSTAQQL
jgi:uncharacterized protein YggE